jgi:transcription termination factor Rho
MPDNTGILEVLQGDGRLRELDGNYVSDPRDPVISSKMIDKYQLRPGVELEVELGRPIGGNGRGMPQQAQRSRRGKKKSHQQRRKKIKLKDRLNPVDPKARTVANIVKIDGMDPGDYSKEVTKFEDLTTIDPAPRLVLEHPGCPDACRLIDLFCPIGYGTRGMIVSPPKAGKTTLLQNIANAVSKNHPDAITIALLVDERPEEVTDFRRNVPCKVWASSNDHPPERHVYLALTAIERCKRWAEEGKDVVVVLDSLTRLGRAFNNVPGLVNTGRIMTGGLDSGALAIPKQLFGAARKFEEGGSLTIIATALVDTGSRADQIIFEEFKGTGNMELILDRKIADRRLFPAIDLAASGTRKEHLLLSDGELNTMTALRRRLLQMQPVMQVEQLLKALERFETNGDLVGDRK